VPIALKFEANGATVRILDVNLNDAEAVATEIQSAGGSASAHACDVTDQRQVISDATNVRIAFLVPLVCYLYISYFAVNGYSLAKP